MRGAPPGIAGWGRVGVENALATACRIKAEVVEQDEREGLDVSEHGERAYN